MYSSQVNTFSVERERTERRDAGRRGRPHAWGAPSQPCGRGGGTKRPFEFPIRNSYTSSALPCYSSYEPFLVHNVWLQLMLTYP